MRQYLVALAILLFHATGSAETAPSPDASMPVTTVVQRFYDWYLPVLHDAARADNPIRLATRRMRGAFSPPLAAALKEDLAASAKEPGEIVGLDYDPFLNSQDPCERYEVGRVVEKSNTATVEVYGICQGKKETAPSILVSLARKHGRWLFVDFGTVANPHELTETLNKLKGERRRVTSKKSNTRRQ